VVLLTKWSSPDDWEEASGNERLRRRRKKKKKMMNSRKKGRHGVLILREGRTSGT
jgi:hypothetical protein